VADQVESQISIDVPSVLVERLSELGASILIRCPGEWGSRDTYIRPNELAGYLSDPEELVARHLGVTRTEFLAWQDEGFSVQCAARTKRGKRCRGVVTGGSHVPAKIWVQMQGGFCVAHEDGLPQPGQKALR